MNTAKLIKWIEEQESLNKNSLLEKIEDLIYDESPEVFVVTDDFDWGKGKDIIEACKNAYVDKHDTITVWTGYQLKAQNFGVSGFGVIKVGTFKITDLIKD